MTESPAPSKFAKWKRPLIGGLLSALVAGIFGGLAILLKDHLKDGSLFFVLVNVPAIALAGIPAYILEELSERTVITELRTQLAVVGFWFIVGVITTYSTRTNKKAILLWLLVLIIQAPLSFWLLFVMSNG